MRAVRINKVGSITALRLEEIPTPSPGAEEVLIKVMAASVNPSDVKNVQGKMHQMTTPRTPGRDFAGTVVGGKPEIIGREIFGTGDLGLTRDGSHAEFLPIPAIGAALRPANLSAAQAACCGVTFVTAAYGLREAGLAKWQTVVVIGAFGGVGRAASQIALRACADVIGIARTAPPANLPASLARAFYIDSSQQDAAEIVKRQTAGRGADIVFDTVGGTMLLEGLKYLAPRGRIIEISAGKSPNVTIDLPEFYHRQARLIGVDSLSLDTVDCAKILSELSPGFTSGEFSPPPIAATYALNDAIEAYEAVDAGKGEGRHVLLPNG